MNKPVNDFITQNAAMASKGTFNLIQGGIGQGKTSFVMQLCKSYLDNGSRVLFLSASVCSNVLHQFGINLNSDNLEVCNNLMRFEALLTGSSFDVIIVDDTNVFFDLRPLPQISIVAQRFKDIATLKKLTLWVTDNVYFNSVERTNKIDSSLINFVDSVVEVWKTLDNTMEADFMKKLPPQFCSVAKCQFKHPNQ